MKPQNLLLFLSCMLLLLFPLPLVYPQSPSNYPYGEAPPLDIPSEEEEDIPIEAVRPTRPPFPVDPYSGETVPGYPLQRNVIPRNPIPRNMIPRNPIPRYGIPRHSLHRDRIPRNPIPRNASPRNQLPRNQIPRNPIPRNRIPRGGIDRL